MAVTVQVLRRKLLGLLGMPFNRTAIPNLYCVGDSTFPGQGLNAVSFLVLLAVIFYR
jgi:phytoene dehydrogenase-like protein